MKILTHKATLLHSTPDPEKIIEMAARLCWKSDCGNAENRTQFIRSIKSKNHESVLEHASAGFIIQTDRGISHELVRHRIASYSQTSTRYCNYSKDKFGSQISVIKPIDLDINSSAYISWEYACQVAEMQYMEMLAKGCRPQIARSVLPTCTATEIAMSANFREWRHFLKLRFSEAAHPDMREVARLIKDKLCNIAPVIFEEWI